MQGKIHKGESKMSEKKLICKNVNKIYGKGENAKQALAGVDLELEEGKLYGLIGRNGAGKTTLLSVLAAHMPMTSGEVLLDGEQVWENPEALKYICFSRELNVSATSTLGSVKVKDYLWRASLYFPGWDKEYAKELIKKFDIDTRKKLRTLSKGMLSMVTITVALASKALFTFLDEPVAGLDVVAREHFYQMLIDEQERTGRTFVISTHIIEEAADYLEEVIILDKGKILLKENTVELVERAVEVNGSEAEVDRAVAGLETHNAKKFGRGKRVNVLLREGEKMEENPNVTITPMNLQSVFVALCGDEEKAV